MSEAEPSSIVLPALPPVRGLPRRPRWVCRTARTSPWLPRGLAPCAKRVFRCAVFGLVGGLCRAESADPWAACAKGFNFSEPGFSHRNPDGAVPFVGFLRTMGRRGKRLFGSHSCLSALLNLVPHPETPKSLEILSFLRLFRGFESLGGTCKHFALSAET